MVTHKKEHLVRSTISAQEERLADEGFVRVHRSTIVKCDAVDRAVSHANGSLSLVLDGGRTVRVGRSYRAEARKMIRTQTARPGGSPSQATS